VRNDLYDLPDPASAALTWNHAFPSVTGDYDFVISCKDPRASGNLSEAPPDGANSLSALSRDSDCEPLVYLHISLKGDAGAYPKSVKFLPLTKRDAADYSPTSVHTVMAAESR